MKLHDKKNGEILEVKLIQTNCECLTEHEVETCYGEEISLETLSRYFEDYKPKEPLIKDEKIRKAVRAWADANSLKWAAYSADGKFYDKTTDYVIIFKTYANRSHIPECKLLPITELCGEEEE